MTSSCLQNLNVLHVTKNQPFCAGILLTQRDRLILTLNTDGLPLLNEGPVWRVGGIGGGQEPGETIWECAQREAREELSIGVRLLSSSITYFHDIDTGKISLICCSDGPAPFLLERQSNLFPYTPYRPGLPSGPYTYFGLFLAQREEEANLLQPGDDIAGLLSISLEQWPLLLQQPTLSSVLRQGIELIEQTSLARDGHLWVHPNESMRTAVPLLQKHTPPD